MNAAIRPALASLARAAAPGGTWCVNLSAGGNEPMWMQVMTDSVNFWYPYDDDPLERLTPLIPLPPGTELLGFLARTYATLGTGDWDLERSASLVDALLTRFYGLPENLPLDVRLEDLG